MHDLMDRAMDEQEVDAIRQTLVETPGATSVQSMRVQGHGFLRMSSATTSPAR
jgi:divalent metal cation (Fe/Co/Zn/Cd) transporter